jgi:DNA-binding CsgD family transcriptional regulator
MPRTPQHLSPLTEKQLQVVRLSDLTIIEIGSRLGISPSSVVTRMDSIKIKFGVFSKQEITEIARQRGLL